MHVALYSPAWPPSSSSNGVVTYVAQMRTRLQEDGHQVSVFFSGEGADVPSERAHLVKTPLRSRLMRWARTSQGHEAEAAFSIGFDIAHTVAAVHRREPIDVIEMEESFGWAEEVARRTAIPTVVKLHGPAFLSLVEEELESSLAAVKIRREGEALRRAVAITSPARRTLDQTVARYGLKPPIQRHIVNPVTVDAAAPIWNVERCDRKSLLFVGRIDKRKGADILLEAFGLLLGRDPELRLVMVGPDNGIVGPDGRRRHFADLRDAALSTAQSSRVTFLGKLSPAEISTLRVKSLLTVMPSRWENQGYTSLEAMLQGCPIVSSDAGGQAEIVEHGVSGLLAETGSAEDLARQIESLVADPASAAELGAQARRYALCSHSPAAVVARTLDVYRDAVKSRATMGPV